MNIFGYRFCLFIFLFLFIPLSSAWAQGSIFFEFSPDSSIPLLVSSVTNLAQTFLPQNEFVGGVDLWLDNTGSSGPVTVELRTLAGTFIASRTITVNTTGSVEGGQSFHFDFLGQPAVESNEKYLLKIISNLPELSIYYSSRISFVGHNAPQVSVYINGVALVNDEEQDYSFKFALYEEPEDAEPVIENVVASNINETQTKIDFNANEPVDFKIDYGLVGLIPDQHILYSGNYIYCGQGIISCSATLNVQANQNYEYRLTVKDTWGNEVAYIGTFQSSVTATPTPVPSNPTSPTPTPSNPAEDTTPPIISNLRLPALGDKWAHFAWSTDEASNSLVVVQLLPNLITEGGNSDATLELEHFIKVEGTLTPDTYYLATITSTDTAGNSRQASVSFLTLQSAVNPTPPPTPGPQESSLTEPAPSQTPNIETIGDPGDPGSVTINWAGSGQGTGFRIDIFDNQNILRHSLIVGPNERSLKIPGLEDGQYRAIVYEEHDGAYQKVSAPESFKIDRRSFFEKIMSGLVSYIWYIVGGLVILVGAGWWYSRNRKTKVLPSSPTPPTGAMPVS